MSFSSQMLADKLKADLRAAMKARHMLRVATLRTMISALDNATAVDIDPSYVPMEGRTPDVPRRELTLQEQLDILRAEAAGRQSAAERYEQLGKVDESARLRAELEVFRGYLDNVDP